jgi:mxaJ protein
MSSRCPDAVRRTHCSQRGGPSGSQRGRASLAGLLLAAISAAALAALPGAVANGPLRVCADPDNAPFSRADGSGFENRIARLVADSLGVAVEYYWWPQRRGFVRNTLDANVCDVVVGIPQGTPGLLTTAAYYRAGYVFAWRADRIDALRSFDDPRLRGWRIGVPLVGNDMAASPPGAALARRGLVDNVIGYPPLGRTPVAERMMAALADGTLDVALLWAPQAAWFARQQMVEVRLAPAYDPRGVAPQAFAMSMGVRGNDAALRTTLERALEALHPQVEAVLRDYGIPIDAAGGARADAASATAGRSP